MVLPTGVVRPPVVLMFHGCGGKRPFLARYMRAAAEVGVASIAIDSYAPRGWSRAWASAFVCTGVTFWGAERAGDVLAACWGVRQRADVDGSRMVLAGWSHGGWSIMDLMSMGLERAGEAALTDPTPEPLKGVKGVVLAYPYCGPGALTNGKGWRRTPAVLGFVASHDLVSRPEPCRVAFASAERSGAEVETWTVEGATHAFDEDEQAPLNPFRYDHEMSQEALRRFSAFLTKRLF